MKNKEESWILTASGRQFFPFKPTIESIRIEDIAHALSNICRFGGHAREFYSVAQHSVFVAAAVGEATEHNRHHQLQALLHDASEAYIGDMVMPIKRHMPAFDDLEDGIWPVIAEKFGVSVELESQVKDADLRALMTERRDLLEKHKGRWNIDDWGIEPYEDKIEPMSSHKSKEWFLKYFKALTK